LETAVAARTGSEDDRRELKRLKVSDLLVRPFAEIFTITEVPFDEPLYAPLAPSEPCAICGEMTMAVKMIKIKRWTASLHSLFGKKITANVIEIATGR